LVKAFVNTLNETFYMLGKNQISMAGNLMRHFGCALKLGTAQLKAKALDACRSFPDGAAIAAYELSGPIDGHVFAICSREGAHGEDAASKLIYSRELSEEILVALKIELKHTPEYDHLIIAPFPIPGKEEEIRYQIHKLGGIMSIRVQMSGYLVELYARRIRQPEAALPYDAPDKSKGAL